MLQNLPHPFCNHLWLALGVAFLFGIGGFNPATKGAVIETMIPVSTSAATLTTLYCSPLNVYMMTSSSVDSNVMGDIPYRLIK